MIAATTWAGCTTYYYYSVCVNHIPTNYEIIHYCYIFTVSTHPGDIKHTKSKIHRIYVMTLIRGTKTCCLTKNTSRGNLSSTPLESKRFIRRSNSFALRPSYNGSVAEGDLHRSKSGPPSSVWNATERVLEADCVRPRWLLFPWL